MAVSHPAALAGTHSVWLSCHSAYDTRCLMFLDQSGMPHIYLTALAATTHCSDTRMLQCDNRSLRGNIAALLTASMDRCSQCCLISSCRLTGTAFTNPSLQVPLEPAQDLLHPTRWWWPRHGPHRCEGAPGPLPGIPPSHPNRYASNVIHTANSHQTPRQLSLGQSAARIVCFSCLCATTTWSLICSSTVGVLWL